MCACVRVFFLWVGVGLGGSLFVGRGFLEFLRNGIAKGSSVRSPWTKLHGVITQSELLRAKLHRAKLHRAKCAEPRA